ncbi:MAG: ABC transporter ATP-binding protein [Acidimicrobiales bacterium]
MTLEADVAVRLGDLDLRVDLHAPTGSVTAVLGPNGAGKTTLLRTIAGSLAIDRGSITLGGTTLDAPPDVFVPQERRRLGIVHQDYLLFPNLTVLDNVAFGPRSQHGSARRSRQVAHEWLARIGIASLAAAKPRALSGGQAQRVALARALAAEPVALLLDEPLAALDAGTRVEVRRDLRRYLSEYPGTTVLVTHDPVDTLALADHIAILERGRITQTGTITEVTTRPRSRYVADLIGTNLVHGTAAGTTITADSGTTFTTAEPHQGAVFATIAPAAVALHRREPEGSPRNRWRTSVDHLDLLGDRVRVHLAHPVSLTAEITPAAVSELGLREGDHVWATAKATEITTYPR